jgi:hypothetical protein
VLYNIFKRCIEAAEGGDDESDATWCWCCICPIATGATVGTYALRIAMNIVWITGFAVLLTLEGLVVCLTALCGWWLLLLDDEGDEGCCAGEETWCFCLECCDGCTCDSELGDTQEDVRKVSMGEPGSQAARLASMQMALFCVQIIIL